jgi:ribose transport system ATP-binding protein
VVTQGSATVEQIQHKMVGRNVDREYYREQRQKPYDASKILVEMKGVGLPGRIRDITLKLHAGEVLCLVGTEGSGREAILRTIYGMRTPVQGTVDLKGQQVTAFTPQAAVAAGVGYVPRERKIEGIVAGMTVYENMTLSQLDRHSSAGVLKVAGERALARDWIGRLKVKAHSEYADCGNLSGGNQQKVVLAKWRSAGSDIMLLDHPTRGLDIGAKEDVYEMIRDMSAEGVGIVLVADTLEEAIGLSHTIIVIKDGAIQKQFDCAPGAKPSLFDLLHHMI